MTTLTIPGRIPLKRVFLYKNRTFRVDEFGAETKGRFRVYSFWVNLETGSGLTFLGAGDLDLRTTLPRWLIRPAGKKAELLLSDEDTQQAIYKVCDAFLGKCEV